MKIYPNPSRSTSYISIPEELVAECNLVVTNRQGETIHEQSYSFKARVHEVRVPPWHSPGERWGGAAYDYKSMASWQRPPLNGVVIRGWNSSLSFDSREPDLVNL